MKKPARIWAGAAVMSAAVTAVVIVYNAGVATVPSSLVAIDPCRLLDTRPAPDGVGEVSGPLNPGDTETLAVVGTHGNCTIPAGATAVTANVTIVNPTASGYLTVFPAGTERPQTSVLNWEASPSGDTEPRHRRSLCRWGLQRVQRGR